MKHRSATGDFSPLSNTVFYGLVHGIFFKSAADGQCPVILSCCIRSWHKKRGQCVQCHLWFPPRSQEYSMSSLTLIGKTSIRMWTLLKQIVVYFLCSLV